jgi:DNA-binding response OmpR family regulator
VFACSGTDVERKVLLVDDYRHSREGVRDALVAAGWSVETAGDSWQAVRRIRDGGFDVAVIDLDLPPVHGVTVSGWDLVRICRAFNPETPIVVVSADGSAEPRGLGERLMVTRLLVKPIDVAELKIAVRCGREEHLDATQARP